MKDTPSADRVWREIEFEIIQGAVPGNELGQSIQAVRQHLNRVRSEMQGSGRKATETRGLVNKQFQINDMLVTLLQEVASELQSLALELQHVRRMVRDATPTLMVASVSEAESGDSVPRSVDLSTPEGPDEDPYGWPPDEVEMAMYITPLQIELEVRPVGVPIIGGLLTRLRNAVHGLPLFYTQRLAARQAAINETYGRWILHLYRLQQHQEEQIEALLTQLAALRAHLAEGDPSAATATDL
jgi:hypothetical protein